MIGTSYQEKRQEKGAGHGQEAWKTMISTLAITTKAITVSDAYTPTNAELSDSSFDDNMKSDLAELDTSEEFQDIDVSNVTRRKRRNESSGNKSVTFDLPSEKQDSSPPKKNRASTSSTIKPDASLINSKAKTKKKNSLLIPSATKSMKIGKPSKKNDGVYKSNDSTESPIEKNKKVFPEEKHDTSNSLINKMKPKKYNYSSESQNENDTSDSDEHSSNESESFDSSIQEVFTSIGSKKKKNVTNPKVSASNKKLKSGQEKESADREKENVDSAITSVCLSVPLKQKEVNLKGIKKFKKDKNNLSKAKVQKQVLNIKLQDDKDKKFAFDQSNLSTSSISGNLLSQVLNNVSTPLDKKDHTSNINSENTRKKKKLMKDDVAKMFVPSFEPNIEVEKQKKRKKGKTTVSGALNSLTLQTCETTVEGAVEGQPAKLLDLSPNSIAKEVLAKVKKGNKKGNKKNNKQVSEAGSQEVNIITEKTNAKMLNNKTNDVDNNISSDQLESSLPVVGKKISGKGSKKKEKNLISDSVKNKTGRTKVISTKTAADNTENDTVNDRPSLSAAEIRDKLLTEVLKGKKKKAKKTKNQATDIGFQKNAEDIVIDVLKENTDKNVSSHVEDRLSLSVSEIKDKLLTKTLKEKKKKTKNQTVKQNDITEVNTGKPHKESEVNETDESSKVSKEIKTKTKKGANQKSNTHFQMKVGTTEKTQIETVDPKDKSPERQSLSVIEIKDALLTKVLKEKKKGKKTGKQVSDVSVERVNDDIQQSVSEPDYVQAISALQSSLTSSVLKNDTEKIKKSKTKKGKEGKSSDLNEINKFMNGDGSDNEKAENSDKSLESSLSVSAIQDELLAKAFESKKSKKKKNKNKISEKSNDNMVLKNTETAQILSKGKGKVKEGSQKDSVKTSKNKGLHNKENLKIDIDSLPLFSQIELAQKIKGNKLSKGKKESNLHDISRKSNGKVNKVSRKKSTKKIM